jgi:CheY-like chemotaxis protein
MDDSMVLVLVDDLMFLSKVRSAAARLGVQISTSRSPAAPIEDMRQQKPALVILDLNNRRADALATVAAMKEDPSLSTIPTVAFAGHTQLDLLAAARQSGVGEVLTKGAFTEMLPEILGRVAGTAGS